VSWPLSWMGTLLVRCGHSDPFCPRCSLVINCAIPRSPVRLANRCDAVAVCSRATASNPHGQTVRRTKVVIGWLALACEAAFLQMSGGDLTHRTAVRFSWAGRSLSARFPLSRFTGFEDTNIETKESDSCWQKDRHHSERSKAHISLLCFMDDSTTTSLDGSPPSSSD